MGTPLRDHSDVPERDRNPNQGPLFECRLQHANQTIAFPRVIPTEKKRRFSPFTRNDETRRMFYVYVDGPRWQLSEAVKADTRNDVVNASSSSPGVVVE
ncbi:unnamed protein product [Caenorhabditis auriculariae]|uniref:Uncharacterized protein n=1 Tax=Caenorhabditis auriculariae TaxID=2777116 RepID=A0A8S1HYN2_9PELO|nr:unnamed protein product [Caenorhabditis auriculariae]